MRSRSNATASMFVTETQTPVAVVVRAGVTRGVWLRSRHAARPPPACHSANPIAQVMIRQTLSSVRHHPPLRARCPPPPLSRSESSHKHSSSCKRLNLAKPRENLLKAALNPRISPRRLWRHCDSRRDTTRSTPVRIAQTNREDRRAQPRAPDKPIPNRLPNRLPAKHR